MCVGYKCSVSFFLFFVLLCRDEQASVATVPVYDNKDLSDSENSSSL